MILAFLHQRIVRFGEGAEISGVEFLFGSVWALGVRLQGSAGAG